jgi:hypothetical protein
MAVSKASLRGLRLRARLEKMKEAVTRKGIRVTPANDTMRRLLRHPHAGGFGKEGSVEWPNDRFTKRRLADGDITVEEQHDNHHDERHRRRPRHEENNAA